MKKKSIIIILCIILIWGGILHIQHLQSRKLIESIENTYLLEADEREKEIIDLISKSWNINALNGIASCQLIEFTTTTPLSAACKAGDLKTVQRLMERDAKVNAVALEASSPLTELIQPIWPWSEERNDILELLLENGADPNSSDLAGAYPMLNYCKVLVEEEDVPLYQDGFRLLLAYGADVYVVDNQGHNALMEMVAANNIVMTEYLLENYVFDINEQNIYGNTALMYAIGNPEMAKLLIMRGADKLIQNHEGETAYDRAKLYGTDECVRILE